jgi:hypothetical protein
MKKYQACLSRTETMSFVKDFLDTDFVSNCKIVIKPDRKNTKIIKFIVSISTKEKYGGMLEELLEYAFRESMFRKWNKFFASVLPK